MSITMYGDKDNMSSMESGRMDSFESTKVTETVEPTENIDKSESDKVDFSDCGNNEAKKDTENSKHNMVEEFNKCEKDDSSHQENKETVSKKENCFDDCGKTERNGKQSDEEYENYKVFDDCSSMEKVEENQNDINNQKTYGFDSCVADNNSSTDFGFVDDVRIQEGMYKQEFDRFEEEKPTVDLQNDSGENSIDVNNDSKTPESSENTGDVGKTDENKKVDTNTKNNSKESKEFKEDDSNEETRKKYEQKEQKEKSLYDLRGEQELENNTIKDLKQQSIEIDNQYEIHSNSDQQVENDYDNKASSTTENDSENFEEIKKSENIEENLINNDNYDKSYENSEDDNKTFNKVNSIDLDIINEENNISSSEIVKESNNEQKDKTGVLDLESLDNHNLRTNDENKENLEVESNAFEKETNDIQSDNNIKKNKDGIEIVVKDYEEQDLQSNTDKSFVSDSKEVDFSEANYLGNNKVNEEITQNELKIEKDISDQKTNEKTAIFENVSYHQGNNDFGALGTCGPTSIANSLNRVTETNDYSENVVLHNAMDYNLCSKNDNPYKMGGTTTRDVILIIENFKDEDVNIHTELFEYDNSLSVEELANKLEDSKTVAIVGVDSATLWDQRGNVSSSRLFRHTEAPSDHWITVDSPIRDDKGDLIGFNIIDSGGGVDYVDKEKFKAMYQGDARHTVSDPTAIVITSGEKTTNEFVVGQETKRSTNYKSDAAESVKGDARKDTDEIKSIFSKENFITEYSYDSKCSEGFLNLKNKNVMEMSPMGTEEKFINRSDTRVEYTPDEIAKLKEARDAIENPKRDTVMQKVIAVDSGNLHEDLKAYLAPTVWDSVNKKDTNIPCDCKIYGFVSKAEDTVPFTQTPKNCYEELRLDYENTKYRNPDQSVYVVRYTGDTNNYDIPYSKEFGGTRTDGQPFTGNGYTGSKKHVIPEYVSNGTSISAGEIYRIKPDGSEESIAYYDSKQKTFVLYNDR